MNDLNSIQGKSALVLGGSRGIGAAIARRLAAGGASVVITYVQGADAANAVVDDISKAGGRAIAVQADSANDAAIEAAVAKTKEAFGSFDILVNNAGVLAIAPIEDFTTEDLDRTLAVNVRAAVIASRAAARVMGQGGRIIHIGSTNAERMPFAGGAVYAMSKSALVGLTQGLARDLGPKGITVNVVQPGPIDTDMNPAKGPMAEGLIPFLAVGRYGHADEVASFVAYLAGPEAANITGASLMIDGGFAA
ncbi:3-oxoacyl-[acyl-carrier protein] reductase [Luteibacter sp. UNCMF331Sha3.1]|uniref:3-oxoacyl-ACP reductase family protein n=1 Tax=Luteibacter sp. UNCMF331Sha3.1 TaxID=1502760 RepID=UPI0008C998E4|nr:3-oxoacyl-ACP reductase family protein [Luteibacter sp. UNCMF331Sha3.1]SEN12825.1 3-oxoacyl-[acyl-carrier protein] reductase [Luteibacter sp. UNCMF331Sha3.1]